MLDLGKLFAICQFGKQILNFCYDSDLAWTLCLLLL